MNELVKINYETEQPTVSARDLHEKLEISKRFSAWFETNSKGFVEGQDYTTLMSLRAEQLTVSSKWSVMKKSLRIPSTPPTF